MLVFIISLRSRSVTKDWDKVMWQCRRTVASCCAQTGSNFRVVVVCSDPIELPAHPDLLVVRDEFKVPQNREEQMNDKYLKIQRGLIATRDWAPFYWMKVDADDLISNRLAAFVESCPNSHGWNFPSGYIYTEGDTRIYRERHHFDRICGTSTILFAASPESLPCTMQQRLSDFSCLSISHSELATFMAKAGTPLQPLPFPGAVYCTGTGENWSGFAGVTQYKSIRWTLRRLLYYRPLTERIRLEFGLGEPRNIPLP